jgi:hypothetical protein
MNGSSELNSGGPLVKSLVGTLRSANIHFGSADMDPGEPKCCPKKKNRKENEGPDAISVTASDFPRSLYSTHNPHGGLKINISFVFSINFTCQK